MGEKKERQRKTELYDRILIVFSDNLRKVQQNYNSVNDRNMSQKDLAESIGVPPSTVSAWFNQGYLPTIDQLVLLANAFNVPVEMLIPFSTYYIEIQNNNLYRQMIEENINQQKKAGLYNKMMVDFRKNLKHVYDIYRMCSGFGSSMSRQQLADYIGVPLSTISAWFDQKYLPTLDQLVLLANALAVPVEMLIPFSMYYKEFPLDNQYRKKVLHSWRLLIQNTVEQVGLSLGKPTLNNNNPLPEKESKTDKCFSSDNNALYAHIYTSFCKKDISPFVKVYEILHPKELNMNIDSFKLLRALVIIDVIKLEGISDPLLCDLLAGSLSPESVFGVPETEAEALQFIRALHKNVVSDPFINGIYEAIRPEFHTSYGKAYKVLLPFISAEVIALDGISDYLLRHMLQRALMIDGIISNPVTKLDEWWKWTINNEDSLPLTRPLTRHEAQATEVLLVERYFSDCNKLYYSSSNKPKSQQPVVDLSSRSHPEDILAKFSSGYFVWLKDNDAPLGESV